MLGDYFKTYQIGARFWFFTGMRGQLLSVGEVVDSQPRTREVFSTRTQLRRLIRS